MESKASAVWEGGIKDGNGKMTGGSGAFTDLAYSFATRFEGKDGSNPEELIAAAHAGCYSMALSNILGQAGMSPERISATATVTLDKTDAGPTVTKSHLVVKAKVPGASDADFQEAAKKAKEGCPISRLLKAEISMDASLEG
jgi:lipoyl-dependent peroxiredoxin